MKIPLAGSLHMAVVLALLSTLALQTKKKTDGFVIHFVETGTLGLDPCAGKTVHQILETTVRTVQSLLLMAVELVILLDAHLALGGTCRYHLYVKLKKRREAEAKNVILAAFGAHFDVKQVVVVDDDVDVHNPTQVEWAVATRFQADRDLVVVAGAQGSPLDPSTTVTGRTDGMSAKMGLDATRPLQYEGHTFTRVRVPGEELIDPTQVVQASPEKKLNKLLAD
jgi:3-polyprenyl-4-hydroxybenzoate decarboxylase